MVLDYKAQAKFASMGVLDLYTLKLRLEKGLELFKTIRDVFKEEDRFHIFYKQVFNREIGGCSNCQKQNKLDNSLTQIKLHYQNLEFYINERKIDFSILTDIEIETAIAETSYVGMTEIQIARMMLNEAKTIRREIEANSVSNTVSKIENVIEKVNNIEIGIDNISQIIEDVNTTDEIVPGVTVSTNEISGDGKATRKVRKKNAE